MASPIEHPLIWLREQTKSDTLTLVILILSTIGATTLLSKPLSLLRLLLTFTPLAQPFKLPLTSLLSRTPSSPSWAIITGPTGGIGKEFSLQLAKNGFSVFLVGRSKSKLDALKQEIVAGGGKAEVHAIDLGNATEADWAGFSSAVAELPGAPTILINNAGISHAAPSQFSATPTSELLSIPAVNVLAPLRVTYAVLPHMEKNKKGLVLNVGSFSALVPTPWLATYAGSKGFLYTWSQALGAECAEKGITVRLLNTYFVASEMSKIRRATWMIPTPKTYVQSVLSSLSLGRGAQGKAYVSTPYFAHALVQWFVDGFWTEKGWLGYNLSMQKGIAKRVEKKRLRELQGKAKAA